MQNYNQGDAVSSAEAQQVLSAWANRQQAQRADPGANSVQALAAGLGVSEDQVRQMLEDIRVNQRSQQIAAGIIDQQQKQRKRSDINAAFIAAAVIVIMAIIAIPVVLLIRANSGPPSGAAEWVDNFPPIPEPPDVAELDTNVVTHVGSHGDVITIDESGFHEVTKGGSVLTLSGQAAIEAINLRIDLTKKEIAELKAKKELAKDEQARLEEAQSRLNTLQEGLKVLKKQGTPAHISTSER